MNDKSKTWSGIGCGVAAGALWGGIFLAPELTRDFSPLQLTVGRYLFYGLFATMLLVPRWQRLASVLAYREWRALIWQSLLGNIFYYVLVGSAVQMGGIAMTTLIIGFMPVAVTIVGSRDDNAIAFGKLIPSLLLGIAGIACIGWQSLAVATQESHTTTVAGLLCAIGALLSWTSYAVENSRWLARLDHISADDWNLLTGMVTGILALLILPPVLLIDARPHGADAWLKFSAVAAGVAVLASIVGNSFWNRMSRLLPLTLVGQMILFETLFALLYGFLWERRLPTKTELAAIVFVIASVLSCVVAHRPKANRL